VIDDRVARKCAEALRIPLRGTLGLILIARRRGEIPSARDALDRLIREEMFLSPRVVEAALREIGE
jgi:predicted nucleic acid-binding protein